MCLFLRLAELGKVRLLSYRWNLPNYGFVFVCAILSKVNLRHYLLSGDQFKIQTSFGQFSLRYFFVITLVQSKQICSFERRRRNVLTLDYLGWSEWNRFFPPFNSRTSKCNPRHQLPVTPLLMFCAKRKWKLFKRDKSTSRDFIARSAAWQPNNSTTKLYGLLFAIFCSTPLEFLSWNRPGAAEFCKDRWTIMILRRKGKL